ncbi:MAG: rRNA maturation RNase YbeY [Mycoplasmatales bacterium]
MIVNEFNYEINELELSKYIEYLKTELKIKKNLTIVFVDNDYITTLNKQFRAKDYATDVLTFVENMEDYLGDIIISYPKAQTQAKEYQHSLQREIYFLITHGFLHLLGYDHQTITEEKVMFTKQEELLNLYGMGRENAK